ncbi:MAG: 2-alkenal reductase, partial [Parcubacteria group bacterium Greene0714_36]
QKRFRLPIEKGAFVLREGLPGQSADGTMPDRPAIMPGSAAERAGLREGDIIISLNNIAIDEKNAIEDVLEKIAIGEKVPIGILRDGKEETLLLTAEEREDTQ